MSYIYIMSESLASLRICSYLLKKICQLLKVWGNETRWDHEFKSTMLALHNPPKILSCHGEAAEFEEWRLCWKWKFVSVPKGSHLHFNGWCRNQSRRVLKLFASFRSPIFTPGWLVFWSLMTRRHCWNVTWIDWLETWVIKRFPQLASAVWHSCGRCWCHTILSSSMVQTAVYGGGCEELDGY